MATKAFTHLLLIFSIALGIHSQSTTSPLLAPSPTPTIPQQTTTWNPTSNHHTTTWNPTSNQHTTTWYPISTDQAPTLNPANNHQVVGTAPHTYHVMDTPEMYSDKWEVGKRLIGYVQMQMDVISLASCFSQCTRMLPNCESLNMSLNPKVNSSLYICELNSKSVYEDPMAQIGDPNYVYYDVFSNK